MSKNPHGRILKGEPKKQHLSTVPKFCPIYIYIVKAILASSVRREKKTLVNPYHQEKAY